MYFHFVVVHMHVQSCFFWPIKTYWFIAVLVAIASLVYRGCRMPILPMGITGREMWGAGFGVRDGVYGTEGTFGSEY